MHFRNNPMRNLSFNRIICFVIQMYFLFVTQQLTYAEDEHHGFEEGKKHVHGAHEECPLPKSRMDIVNCAIHFHPIVKRSVLRIDSSSKLQEQANQIPNPTLSSRFVKGDNNGVDVSELEASLSFTLELGGKRNSRTEFAMAKKEEAIANAEAVKADLKKLTIISMYRLRQVIEEKKLLSEATVAFTRVIEQLRKLPRFSAEQEASLTLFEMAFEETKINESELFEEERKLEHFFHVSTGHSVAEIREYLPESPYKWPELSSSQEQAISPEIKKLKSLATLAETKLEIEKSDAWPNLIIGPSIAIEKDGGTENRLVGFNIQIPIPLFQVNGGSKSYARNEFIRAQKNIELMRNEENHERFEQLQVYESSVNVLNKTMKQKLIEEKHDRIEKLYLRGVVSSSVFLDSLKQKMSYLRNRNQREIAALNALWSLHIYDGKIFKEKI